MEITVEGEKREFEGKTIADLLNAMEINPVTVVTKVNGKIKTEEQKLSEGDRVDFVSVVSGG